MTIKKVFSQIEDVEVYDQDVLCGSFIGNTKLSNKLITNKEVTRAFGYRPTKHDDNSMYLILGTIPSMSGLQQGFYYMSNNNSFYEILDKALSYKNTYIDLKNDYVNANKTNKLNKGIAVEKQLNEDHIVLFDTLSYCRRINSYDSGIIDYQLHDSKDYLFADGMLIIITSEEAERYFKEIFPHIKNVNIPFIKDHKTKIEYEDIMLNKNTYANVIRLPSPSFSNTQNNKTKIDEIGELYKNTFDGFRYIEIE